MTRALDAQWMRRALANALHGWGQTAPNPMVGAVVVSGDAVVADGWHVRFGGVHAEVMAIGRSGDRAIGASLYVTLEPCTHHGQTPPCVDAVIAAGLSRVVIAARDPNPRAGGGVEKLRAAGIAVDVGVLEDEARELNAAFFNSFASPRPWVTLKFAVSADGGVADPAGKRRWITGEESRREVHRMRANADAVAVGLGTVLADDPELTVREGPPPRRQPTRVVFDSSVATPTGAKLVRTARETPTIVVSRIPDPARRSALEALGVTVIRADDPASALSQLRAIGIHSLLLEGGPRLAGSFLAAGLVDRIAIFTSPFTLGADAPRAFSHGPAGFAEALNRLPEVERKAFDEDSLIIRAVTPIRR